MSVKLVWDSKKNGGQSDVYQTGSHGEIAQKVYFGIKREDLILYLKTQKKLSEKNLYIIKLEKEEELDIGNGKKIKEIHFDILDLNTEIFESTSIENRTSMFSSEQKFIKGESLSDFLKKNGNLFGDWINYLHLIPIIIGDFISNLFNINMSNSYYLQDEQINFHNIKVKNYDKEKGILSITITDIAQIIPLFIENNRENILKILNKKITS